MGSISGFFHSDLFSLFLRLLFAPPFCPPPSLLSRRRWTVRFDSQFFCRCFWSFVRSKASFLRRHTTRAPTPSLAPHNRVKLFAIPQVSLNSLLIMRVVPSAFFDLQPNSFSLFESFSWRADRAMRTKEAYPRLRTPQIFLWDDISLLVTKPGFWLSGPEDFVPLLSKPPSPPTSARCFLVTEQLLPLFSTL